MSTGSPRHLSNCRSLARTPCQCLSRVQEFDGQSARGREEEGDRTPRTTAIRDEKDNPNPRAKQYRSLRKTRYLDGPEDAPTRAGCVTVHVELLHAKASTMLSYQAGQTSDHHRRRWLQPHRQPHQSPPFVAVDTIAGDGKCTRFRAPHQRITPRFRGADRPTCGASSAASLCRQAQR